MNLFVHRKLWIVRYGISSLITACKFGVAFALTISAVQGQFAIDEGVPDRLLFAAKLTYPLIDKISNGPMIINDGTIMDVKGDGNKQPYGVYYRFIWIFTEGPSMVKLERMGAYDTACCLNRLDAREDIDIRGVFLKQPGYSPTLGNLEEIFWIDGTNAILIIDGKPYEMDMTDFIPLGRYDWP